MKIKIDLYEKEMEVLNEKDFKFYKKGLEKIKSECGVVYEGEEYLIIDLKEKN
mgnify:CR=1 FL=1